MAVRRRLCLVVQRKEARKVFPKEMKAFGKVFFALTNQKRVQAMISDDL